MGGTLNWLVLTSSHALYTWSLSICTFYQRASFQSGDLTVYPLMDNQITSAVRCGFTFAWQLEPSGLGNALRAPISVCVLWYTGWVSLWFIVCEVLKWSAKKNKDLQSSTSGKKLREKSDFNLSFQSSEYQKLYKWEREKKKTCIIHFWLAICTSRVFKTNVNFISFIAWQNLNWIPKRITR